jgi:two-component system NtrC family sensor kinase
MWISTRPSVRPSRSWITTPAPTPSTSIWIWTNPSLIIASDQAQLQQIFLNLLTNAIDAIGSGGTIEATSRCSGDKIVVTIKDDGPGLSDDMLRNAFDPFFTTKEPGKGTGLGLWVSHNIITKMDGSIHVKNNFDKGAVVTVEIPIVIPEKK